MQQLVPDFPQGFPLQSQQAAQVVKPDLLSLRCSFQPLGNRHVERLGDLSFDGGGNELTLRFRLAKYENVVLGWSLSTRKWDLILREAEKKLYVLQNGEFTFGKRLLYFTRETARFLPG